MNVIPLKISTIDIKVVCKASPGIQCGGSTFLVLNRDTIVVTRVHHLGKEFRIVFSSTQSYLVMLVHSHWLYSVPVGS